MLIGIANLQKSKDKETRPPTRQSALMKNINRQPGTQGGKDEEVKAGALSNRGALKQPATGKSTFTKHRNTNSIAGASGVAAVNKSMDVK